MVRERDELCITVPSLFRCPISLDVMRSPVSLCTGVTYERSSIQYWLESGHDTCPATMQILSTKEFIPNLTLHRLISTWSRPLTLSEREVRVLIEKVGCKSESKTTVVDCLLKIAEFVSSREENRRFLASRRCEPRRRRFDDLNNLVSDSAGQNSAGQARIRSSPFQHTVESKVSESEYRKGDQTVVVDGDVQRGEVCGERRGEMRGGDSGEDNEGEEDGEGGRHGGAVEHVLLVQGRQN
ncbi:hypothetical protein EZV62_022499 [Acer yangbiense]|uniref:U-box domain-containing protein n=1 Tax=Acer yangbiense TaxID=1000413 RepID=A0A5C7H8I6_9ROSI|nr:hypothetical protein EZV62_022499 [Acer yangbiense]